jgi:voltage-gated potassium channel
MENEQNTWLEYKLQSFRYGMYSRRLPFLLLLNVVLVIFFGSLLLFLLERNINPEIHDLWDAAWCMFVSMATIGYGDVVPVTVGGQITVLVCMIIGIGALSTYITTLATRRVSKTKRRYSGLQGKTNSTNHIVVCGWNSRGPHVIDRLKLELANERRRVVLLADLEESPLEDDTVFFFQGSPSNEADLRRVNIEQAASAVLLADDTRGGSQDDIDSRTVLAALTIRALNQTVNMTAEILQPENIGHLKLARVGEVLDSDVVLGNLIARSALHYGLIGIVTEMVTRKEDMSIYSLPVEEQMMGKSSDEIMSLLQERNAGKLIGVVTPSGFKSYDQPHKMREGDQLLLIAEKTQDGTDVSSD